MKELIAEFHDLQLSSDGPYYVYSQTSAWVTSGAVHVVDTTNAKEHFVRDGRAFEVLRSGKHRDRLLVAQPENDAAELEASELLAAYQPDYFVSGHDHAFPYDSGQSWNQRLGKVRLLVPGQLLGAPLPNYIELNTESEGLSWYTTSETWIPEDRLFDHLIIKVAKD
jgi:hypothetical protein